MARLTLVLRLTIHLTAASALILAIGGTAHAYTIIQVPNNGTTDNELPAISGANVVWDGFDGIDHEIYLWDGATISQITDNSTWEADPEISGLNVVWRGMDGGDSVIYMTTIPEPSTALLLAFGLAGLALRRRVRAQR
jgi:hypothetical protein